jgi:hypothetical protein
LTLGEVVEFPVVKILPVVGVGVQGILVVDHFIGMLLEVEVFLIVYLERLEPTATHLP